MSATGAIAGTFLCRSVCFCSHLPVTLFKSQSVRVVHVVQANPHFLMLSAWLHEAGGGGDLTLCVCGKGALNSKFEETIKKKVPAGANGGTSQDKFTDRSVRSKQNFGPETVERFPSTLLGSA